MAKTLTSSTTTSTADSVSAPIDLGALIAQISGEVETAFSVMEWAEDEIRQAAVQHPEHADTLFHSFSLIRPRDLGPARMNIEFVYRGHARELLERIASGADTRPGTAAEVCLALSQVSLVAPMHGAGVGLYMRMWLAAFPTHPVTDGQSDDQVHYKHLYRNDIDDLEQMMRRKVADPQRRLSDVECQGRHHGRHVECRYAAAGTLW